MNLEYLKQLKKEALEFYNSSSTCTIEDALDHVIYDINYELNIRRNNDTIQGVTKDTTISE